MSQKITMDQEIKNIQQELDGVEDTSPYYLEPELKKIQTYILVWHAYFERSVEALILFKIREVGQFELKTWRILSENLRPILEKLAFRSKLELSQDNYLLTDEAKKIIKPLEKVNSIRNEWVHSNKIILRSKYGATASKGKQEIRNLFRTIKRADDALDEYFKDKV